MARVKGQRREKDWKRKRAIERGKGEREREREERNRDVWPARTVLATRVWCQPREREGILDAQPSSAFR